MEMYTASDNQNIKIFNQNMNFISCPKLITNMLSIIDMDAKPLSQPCNDVIECKSRSSIIAGNNGAICPYCENVLKNYITLNIHMKRCIYKKQE